MLIGTKNIVVMLFEKKLLSVLRPLPQADPKFFCHLNTFTKKNQNIIKKIEMRINYLINIHENQQS